MKNIKAPKGFTEKVMRKIKTDKIEIIKVLRGQLIHKPLQYYGIAGIAKAIKAVMEDDYIIQGNDLIVGIDSMTIPHRYYDFFE